MQIALSEIQNFCSESQKLHYSDLLSLAEDFDEDAKYQVIEPIEKNECEIEA